jgi:hypothetical protein
VADGVLDQVGDQALQQARSPATGAPPSTELTRSPSRSASGRATDSASAAASDRSTGSLALSWRSLRASVSRPSISRSLRSLASRTRSAIARSSAGLVSRSASATSTSVRVMARGVRSSWEALATKRRWVSKAVSSRASIWSKVSASSFSSSSGPCRLIRSCRVLPSSRLAVAVIACSGRSTRPATSQPSPTEASAISPRAMPDWVRSWLRAAACSLSRTACNAPWEAALAMTSPSPTLVISSSLAPWPGARASGGCAPGPGTSTWNGSVNRERTSA